MNSSLDILLSLSLSRILMKYSISWFGLFFSIYISSSFYRKPVLS